MQLDLEAVNDGGLQVKSEFKGPFTTVNQADISGLEEYATWTENAISASSKNLETMRKSLAEDLAN